MEFHLTFPGQAQEFYQFTSNHAALCVGIKQHVRFLTDAVNMENSFLRFG